MLSKILDAWPKVVTVAALAIVVAILIVPLPQVYRDVRALNAAIRAARSLDLSATKLEMVHSLVTEMENADLAESGNVTRSTRTRGWWAEQVAQSEIEDPDRTLLRKFAALLLEHVFSSDLDRLIALRFGGTHEADDVFALNLLYNAPGSAHWNADRAKALSLIWCKRLTCKTDERAFQTELEHLHMIAHY